MHQGHRCQRWDFSQPSGTLPPAILPRRDRSDEETRLGPRPLLPAAVAAGGLGLGGGREAGLLSGPRARPRQGRGRPIGGGATQVPRGLPLLPTL